MERAGSRQLLFPEYVLEVGPPSSRRNVGPGPYYTLYNADPNVFVDREGSSTIAGGEHGQHWGGVERSFGQVGMVGDREEWMLGEVRSEREG
jgi:hypothetical protein